MKKMLILVFFILCCLLLSFKSEANLNQVDAVSGLGYDGHNKLIEEFRNNN